MLIRSVKPNKYEKAPANAEASFDGYLWSTEYMYSMRSTTLLE